MKAVLFISMAMFIIFNIVGIMIFGMKDCYSAYGREWEKFRKPSGINIWSAVTIITSLLLIPPCLEASEGETLQFFCFFAPLSLLLVGMTPDYLDSKQKLGVHYIGAFLSSVLIGIWICFIAHQVIPFAIILAGMLLMMLANWDWKNWTYYIESAFYLGSYKTILTMIS